MEHINSILPTDLIAIVNDYAIQFESAQMIQYAIDKIMNRMDRGSGNPLYLWNIKHVIASVRRELQKILLNEQKNTLNRSKNRTRPYTYRKHMRFKKKDWICARRTNALDTAIQFLIKEYKSWDEVMMGDYVSYTKTLIYLRCVEHFGEPTEQKRRTTSMAYRIFGADIFFKTKVNRRRRIDKDSLFRN